MKSILFMIKNMNIGGIEKALLQMLNEIDMESYAVTVLMLEEYGGFLKSLSNRIKIIYLDGYKDIKKYVNEPPQLVALDLAKRRRYLRAFGVFVNYALSKISGSMEYYYRYILKGYPIIENDYDVAVAYDGPMDLISYFVVKKVRAKRKIQWIHFDVTSIYMNVKFNRKIYAAFNKIFIVSEDGKNKFLELFPKFKVKTEVLHNIISRQSVRNKAQETSGFTDDFAGIRILTVGRLSWEKGQDISIPVLSRLKSEGYNVRWYCVGEGNERDKYEELIKKYNVCDDYLLLGAKENPYPFMKECDVYVQTSRYEGYCITLAEARCFENPIITTDFTGAREQITHEKTGLIVQCDSEYIYEAVKGILDNNDLRDKISRNLACENVDTTLEVKKLYKVIRDSDKEAKAEMICQKGRLV